MKTKADIAVIGLAVMGQNLILNMSDHGFTVVVYNRTISKVNEFLQSAASGKDTIIGASSIQEMIHTLKSPRKIMLMIKAGKAVDDFIDQLIPLLSSGDLIIDGGNSHFTDTIRRTRYLEERGLNFIGTGISGGEEGARNGPSIMPGGSVRAWPLVEHIFRAIAAKTKDNIPCCDWVGSDGAGHYVKMVHNGIEYGDMQLISEAYQILRDGLKLNASDIGDVFAEWNQGDLKSYLIEIAAHVLKFKDSDGNPLIDKILDSAGQKGTGRWTSESALELGVPVTLITEAVYARSLSALVQTRRDAAEILGDGITAFSGNQFDFTRQIREALLASKIVSYAQGFMLMRSAAKQYSWDLDLGGIALMWREGCIIRSAFLDQIKEAFDKAPALDNLLLDDYFCRIVNSCIASWRNVVAQAALMGIAVPALSSALSFYDGYRNRRGSANMIQALRDYFGAHTFERIDRPLGEFFHANWTGYGGDVASGSYNA